MSIRFLKQLPTNENDKAQFANIAIDEIQSGEVSILEAFAVLKHLEDIIELIKSNEAIKDNLFTELDKYPKGDIPTALGYQITKGERKTYDYKNCGDYFLEEMQTKQKEYADNVKQRQSFLQALKQTMVDSENGGFEVKPPMVTYTTYPILKAVKQGIDLNVKTDLPF